MTDAMNVMTDLTGAKPSANAPPTPTCAQLIDAHPAPLVLIDRDYRIVAANAAFARNAGLPAGDIVGRRCHAVSHQSDEPCRMRGEECPLERALALGTAVHALHVHQRPDGSEDRVQLTATPVCDETGEFRWISETMQVIGDGGDDDSALVGRSPALLQFASLLVRAAPTATTVLLLGESGTGKERAAEYIHRHSPRSAGPFVILDCGGLSESLVESELFGYERGAFTGATARKRGLFEAAHGGTLFIDEIGDMPPPLQARLLRALEAGAIRRVGGTEYVPIDVRVIAATHRDLGAMIAAGTFRGDLYFRLAAFPIHVPPLRDRKPDIGDLAAHFLRRMRGGRRHLPLVPAVLERLMAHDYPGNVRELRNVIERAVLLAGSATLRAEHVVFDTGTASRPAAAPNTDEALLSRRSRIADDEVLAALAQANGHRGRAASALGMNERTFYRRLRDIRARRAGG